MRYETIGTTTPVNENGNGNAIYLDRHDVRCNENEAISKIRLNTLEGNRYQFQYKCCK